MTDTLQFISCIKLSFKVQQIIALFASQPDTGYWRVADDGPSDILWTDNGSGGGLIRLKLRLITTRDNKTLLGRSEKSSAIVKPEWVGVQERSLKLPSGDMYNSER